MEKIKIRITKEQLRELAKRVHRALPITRGGVHRPKKGSGYNRARERNRARREDS